MANIGQWESHNIFPYSIVVPVSLPRASLFPSSYLSTVLITHCVRHCLHTIVMLMFPLIHLPCHHSSIFRWTLHTILAIVKSVVVSCFALRHTGPHSQNTHFAALLLAGCARCQVVLGAVLANACVVWGGGILNLTNRQMSEEKEHMRLLTEDVIYIIPLLFEPDPRFGENVIHGGCSSLRSALSIQQPESCLVL